METNRIGFIGFGEVGRAFSQAMQARGAEVHYYDVVQKDPVAGMTFLPLKELLEQCDIILSTAATHVAVAVAEAAGPLLTAQKTYADMNSTSASVKRQIAHIIARSKADFVEGAILSAVGEAGANASILVAGAKAESFARRMNELGLVNLKYFSATVGEASQVKMLRSIFSKGVECLLLEMLIAGRRAGIADYLWKDVVDFMTRHSFQGVGENWIKTHPLACERRYHEMTQVLQTLEELDVQPIMTQGTTEFFKRSVDSGLANRFAKKPETFWEITDALERVRG
jgi:3-hydroxyisobutyrate dehydrogenase-like beta-hydroxyacid dehydrogenase